MDLRGWIIKTTDEIRIIITQTAQLIEWSAFLLYNDKIGP